MQEKRKLANYSTTYHQNRSKIAGTNSLNKIIFEFEQRRNQYIKYYYEKRKAI